MKFKIYAIIGFLILAIMPLNAQLKSDQYDPNDFPGMINPDDYVGACYGLMGKIDFSSEYRYRSQLVNPGLNNKSGAWIDGFTIPLVVDLDGDGYPEIITNSAHSSTLYGYFNGIHIFNGQTGKHISQLFFDSSKSDYRSANHHVSPSIMAVANIFPNQPGIEIIVGFPSHSGGVASDRGKLACYRILPSGSSYTWNRIWTSSVTYNSGQRYYAKPIPQIVDLDGDGIPEVVVYNKVYNAQTGELLLEFLGDGTTTAQQFTNAHQGISNKANVGDNHVAFNYVYDIDMDGIYDVVAGGRIYKISKNALGKFAYETIVMPGVEDGYTGVADINGDGIPDVVTVTKVSNSITKITVWNAGTHQVLSSGEVVKKSGNPSPHILASFDLPIYTGGTGNSSYVYIGDIDGRVQTVNGKEYRVPEIAILGGGYTLSIIEYTPM